MVKRWVAAAMCATMVFGSFPVSAEDQMTTEPQIVAESTDVSTEEISEGKTAEDNSIPDDAASSESEDVIADQEEKTESESQKQQNEKVPAASNTEEVQKAAKAKNASVKSSYRTQVPVSTCVP